MDDGGWSRTLWKGPALITAVILLIPLARSLVVDGWTWDHRGALLVGAVAVFLFGTGLAFQMVRRKIGSTAYRVAVLIALVATFLLVWTNLVQAADDVNPAAVTYFAVPIVALVGAAFARFQPVGMARALFVTALAQAVAIVVVLVVRNPQVTPWSWPVLRGFGGNALLIALFVGSALLFRRAARGAPGLGAV
jgi:hypothetical protein